MIHILGTVVFSVIVCSAGVVASTVVVASGVVVVCPAVVGTVVVVGSRVVVITTVYYQCTRHRNESRIVRSVKITYTNKVRATSTT